MKHSRITGRVAEEDRDPDTGVTYSDAARRCSDLVRQAIVDRNVGRWLAIRLSDGGSDGIAYDKRSDAVRLQLHEQQCAYVKVPADDMSPRAAERFLAINRELYDAGFRLADPEGPDGDTDREIIAPNAIEDAERFIANYRARGGHLS